MSIRINKGDEGYEEIVRFTQEMLEDKDNMILVARGPENRKKEITPCCFIDDVAFYVAVDREDFEFTIFPGELQDGDYETALKNTAKRAAITNIFNVYNPWINAHDLRINFTPVSEWEPSEGEPPLWVLTFPGGKNGAGILACDDVLMNIWNKIGDYYLIPASIHELIVIQASSTSMGVDDVAAMVREVNKSELTERDRLVDTAWLFDGQLNKGEV